MKKFVFDSLVDEENICNLQKEKRLLNKYIKNREHIILYAPRNYGKTSLVKNIIIKEFKKKHKKCFVFFADLMEVKNMEAISLRIIRAFENSFSESFPVKNMINEAKRLLFHLRPEFTMDQLTGSLSLSLSMAKIEKEASIRQIFQTMGSIKKIPVLVILDEFQDIAKVAETQALFREVLEGLIDIPIIIMGSKNHLLTQIFASPDAPLAFWGKDLEFKPIPYEEYRQYILERFQSRKIAFGYEEGVYLQDMMSCVPEAVNRLSQQILEDYENCILDKNQINYSIKRLLSLRVTRYEAYLSNFSEKDERVLCQLAKKRVVKTPQGQEFCRAVKLTHRTIGVIIKKYQDAGIVEKTQNGYRLTDPLLMLFLSYFR